MEISNPFRHSGLGKLLGQKSQNVDKQGLFQWKQSESAFFYPPACTALGHQIKWHRIKGAADLEEVGNRLPESLSVRGGQEVLFRGSNYPEWTGEQRNAVRGQWEQKGQIGPGPGAEGHASGGEGLGGESCQQPREAGARQLDGCDK